MIGATINREAIFQALFDLVSPITWDEPERGFKTASRRLVHWDNCPDQPGFFQSEHDDEFPTDKRGLPYTVVLKAELIVYQNIGKDPKAICSTENNLIKDAIQAILTPKMEAGVPFENRLTLGGLVYDCHIAGRVFSDAGNLDGQGVIVVPVEILVP